MIRLIITFFILLSATNALADFASIQSFFVSKKDKEICYPYNVKTDLDRYGFIQAMKTAFELDTGKMGMSISTPNGTITKDWETIAWTIFNVSHRMSCNDFKKLAIIYASTSYNDNLVADGDMLNSGLIYLLDNNNKYNTAPIERFIEAFLKDGQTRKIDGGYHRYKANRAMVDVISAIFRQDDEALKRSLNIVPDKYLADMRDKKFNIKQWRFEDTLKSKEQLERERLAELKKKYGK
jgi:hypothetical protein